MDAKTLGDVMQWSLSLQRYEQLVGPFNAALIQADCVTVNRVAMFCAQVGHESAGLLYMEELASGDAYEGRRDLGNVQPGDGRRFKGRGPIQVTGRANYRRASQWMFERGLVPTPDYLLDLPHELARDDLGLMGAVWYWVAARNMNAYADAGDIVGASYAVNGGDHGLDDRIQRWNAARRLGDRLLPEGEDLDMAGEVSRDVQLQLRGGEPGQEPLTGWFSWRYHETESARTKLSAVDFLRAIDAKTNSKLPLTGMEGGRPLAANVPDDLWGHVLSARAEGLQNHKLLLAIAAKLEIDVAKLKLGPS
ncbi:glycoside hydrolase family 19 protein [Rhodococcus koreensis]